MSFLRRTIASLLCLALVLALFAAPNAVATQGRTVIGTVTVTNTNRVNVRTGPSTDYAAIGTVNPGETFPCIGIASTGWYEIVLPGDIIGFIHNNLTRLDVAPSSATIPVYYRTVDGRLLYTDNYRVTVGTNEIYANNSYVPQGYSLVSANRVVVSVNQQGQASPSGVLFIYSQGSVSTPAPSQETAQITIYYKDIYGSILGTSSLDLYPGTRILYANDASLPGGYSLVGARDAVVTVSNSLVATPSVVTFLLVRSQVPTQAPIATAVVPVQYKTLSGATLYTDYITLSQGYSTISANDSRVSGDYVLYSGRSAQVYVSPQGAASPAAITFLYQPRPQNVTVTVPVYYRTVDGRTLATDYITATAGTNTIYANDSKVPGYTRQSAGTASVFVSTNGSVSPASVIFTYALPVSATVFVQYLDNAGNLLYSEYITVGVGSRTIYANASRVPAGYVRQSPESVTVNVQQNGAVWPSSITFVYSPPGPGPAPVTPVPPPPPTAPPPPPPPSGGSYVLPQHTEASVRGPYAVYSGPGLNYFRVGGNATIGSGVARFYGTENGWTLMGYQFGVGKYRIGYMDSGFVPAGVSVPALTFMYEPVQVVSKAYLTDDPIIGTNREWITTIPVGTTVQLLGFLSHNWAYIETTHQGQPIRGFINRVRIGR